MDAYWPISVYLGHMVSYRSTWLPVPGLRPADGMSVGRVVQVLQAGLSRPCQIPHTCLAGPGHSDLCTNTLDDTVQVQVGISAICIFSLLFCINRTIHSPCAFDIPCDTQFITRGNIANCEVSGRTKSYRNSWLATYSSFCNSAYANTYLFLSLFLSLYIHVCVYIMI